MNSELLPLWANADGDELCSEVPGSFSSALVDIGFVIYLNILAKQSRWFQVRHSEVTRFEDVSIVFLLSVHVASLTGDIKTSLSYLCRSVAMCREIDFQFLLEVVTFGQSCGVVLEEFIRFSELIRKVCFL